MPGAGKQPPEVQDQIKELLEAGFDPTTIHRRLKVGRSSIYRMKRSLQQHGTAYMPVELNKKNGRPKVLNAEQEIEVRDWLRDPKNRNRYLDDLVWLIHDRFGIVCSTTTMSKLKRKWLRVIECEETGQPIDAATRQLLLETHPNLPILHQQDQVPPAPMAGPVPSMQQQSHPFPTAAYPEPPSHHQHDPQIEPALQAHRHLPVDGAAHYPHQHHQPQIDARLQQYQASAPPIDVQLEQQIQSQIANAEPSRA